MRNLSLFEMEFLPLLTFFPFLDSGKFTANISRPVGPA